MASYDLFLFDADDTLFNFAASEQQSFREALGEFGIDGEIDSYYSTYKQESAKLWRLLELGETTKEILRVERFRKTLEKHNIDTCPKNLGEKYLEILPENVHLNESATEMCQHLSDLGTVGIITNGIESVQKRRLEISGLKKYISFMVVSEECGYVKPDKRFFEYTMTKAVGASKNRSLVIGDRIETDIEGAHSFGMDACWYNPHKVVAKLDKKPRYEIRHLSELEEIAARHGLN